MSKPISLLVWRMFLEMNPAWGPKVFCIIDAKIFGATLYRPGILNRPFTMPAMLPARQR